MGNPFFNSIALLVIGSMLTFMAASFWHWKNTKLADALRLKHEAEGKAQRLSVEAKELDTRVRELETQLGAIRAAVLPISAAFQAILIKELTHFHTPRMDELMAKLEAASNALAENKHADELTPAEEEELSILLAQRATDMNGRIDESERDAAIMLPMIIRRVRAEYANKAKRATVIPVSLPPAVEEPQIP